ncbi:AbrB/MazE/SpoVT family DNA-binding domain-containing protein [Neorhizobium galegae]|jgi:AbrB family looped-hinge helix DNA binding protein|uniref:AbrB/MazE/SpoVT family DNA-binding domain-containing protein n=1 Tax=Neorhizobium galegae TaxID=399 RepID=UPI0006224E4E|nr:AbrB/MazE/SpoVT family DNA-binding domain-containing protein [Neorhizobium galegae]CDZ28397.1 Looped-hinge helix DNA binding domain, AbrB family [Neorhizobium galegae bv. officinalis]CDZ57432.1 Looped-hinge helix DNA binding domain, AbrB family [Neorhizobium galegae bv. orientalis]KAA9388169.1 AbrB/MazE/SpoVT family DNA-binding domain-containing protein [Neorhizobium galegae]KAB1115371.1 AbrB/MazE/SpoVT family DNA-binding domain-containing protein [Neorhizobium galegae]KAB1124253.1 AbrB/Maz
MRVTEKGQVTIPKNVRSNLGIEPGSEVEFVLREGEAVLRRVEPSREEAERNVRVLMDHLRRHQGSMSLGDMSGEEFYRLLRD